MCVFVSVYPPFFVPLPERALLGDDVRGHSFTLRTATALGAFRRQFLRAR